MKIRVKILLFSLSVLSCLSSLEGGVHVSVDYLDESTLFEISWPGKQKVAAPSVNIHLWMVTKECIWGPVRVLTKTECRENDITFLRQSRY